jgi:hypothetical protein
MWDEGRCLEDDLALGPLPLPLRVHLAWEAKKKYLRLSPFLRDQSPHFLMRLALVMKR